MNGQLGRTEEGVVRKRQPQAFQQPKGQNLPASRFLETAEQTQPGRELFRLQGLCAPLSSPPDCRALLKNRLAKLLGKHPHQALSQLEKTFFPKHLERHKNDLKEPLEVVPGSGLRQTCSFGVSCSASTCPSNPCTLTPLPSLYLSFFPSPWPAGLAGARAVGGRSQAPAPSALRRC